MQAYTHLSTEPACGSTSFLFGRFHLRTPLLPESASYAFTLLLDCKTKPATLRYPKHTDSMLHVLRETLNWCIEPGVRGKNSGGAPWTGLNAALQICILQISWSSCFAHEVWESVDEQEVRKKRGMKQERSPVCGSVSNLRHITRLRL